MTEIIVAAISGIALIIVAAVNGVGNHRQKKADDRTKKVGKARLKREAAEMEKAEIIEKLTYLTALKVNEGHVNGELEATINEYRNRRDACNKTIKEALKELEDVYN